MLLSRRRMVGLSLAALAPTPALACPNWRGTPHFGSIELGAGFQPDPYIRNVTVGGTIPLQRCFNGGYQGYVTTRPDFDLYWSGSANQLTIAVACGGTDAILLVSDPGGDWHYSDDYRGSNPALTFANPATGLYDIWIGSYDGARRIPGQLMITEYDF
ncbi:MAG: peptidase S1 [Rhodobacteraceae bacterium]|nr:peptidase S1 [Paracoccaceae bacterium]